jgi:SAM-dependent methyltransferase
LLEERVTFAAVRKVKKFVKSIPVLGPVATKLFGKKIPVNQTFPGSANYWENRYAKGGNSGSGSYDRLAEFKAEVLNKFVADNDISTIIELGCGDGNQLKLAKYPSYVGFDVSQTAITHCRQLFTEDKSKSFERSTPDSLSAHQAQLTLSLDVLFHLIESDVFEAYMRDLFRMSTAHVVIYSSNFEKDQTYHEKDRKFTDWISSYIDGWKLIKHLPNRYPFDPQNPTETSKADFYFYEKLAS